MYTDATHMLHTCMISFVFFRIAGGCGGDAAATPHITRVGWTGPPAIPFQPWFSAIVGPDDGPGSHDNR